MPIVPVNIGAADNDDTGDAARLAFRKLNESIELLRQLTGGEAAMAAAQVLGALDIGPATTVGEVPWHQLRLRSDGIGGIIEARSADGYLPIRVAFGPLESDRVIIEPYVGEVPNDKVLATSAFVQDYVASQKPKIKLISDASYFPLPSDDGYTLYLTGAANQTITIGPLAAGTTFSLGIVPWGTGLPTVVAGTGATRRSDKATPSYTAARRYAPLAIFQLGAEFIVSGVTQ